MKVQKIALASALILIIAFAGFWGLKNIPLLRDTLFHQAGNNESVEREFIEENEKLKAKVAELEQALITANNSRWDSAGTGGEFSQTENADQRKICRELADYYANMNVNAAAAILNSQEPELAAAVLHRMEKEQAGEILSALDPVKAAELISQIREGLSTGSYESYGEWVGSSFEE